MDLGELLKRKDLKQKEKTMTIADALLNGELTFGERQGTTVKMGISEGHWQYCSPFS